MASTDRKPTRRRERKPKAAARATAAESMRALWTCPECGAKLITKNLWHSCGEATIEDWIRSGNLAALTSADDAIAVDHAARNKAATLLPQIALKAS